MSTRVLLLSAVKIGVVSGVFFACYVGGDLLPPTPVY
jgi:hypothetical protein